MEQWQEQVDEGSGRKYRYNTVTGVSQWCDDAVPAEAGAWQAMLDTTSGARYFYNTSTGESRWDDPRTTAEESSTWTRAADASGRVFYYNTATGASSWDLPSKMSDDAATGGASSTTRAATACAKRRSEIKAAPSDDKHDSDDEGEAEGKTQFTADGGRPHATTLHWLGALKAAKVAKLYAWYLGMRVDQLIV